MKRAQYTQNTKNYGRREKHDLPAHLFDPATGEVVFCADAVSLLVERLESDAFEDLRACFVGFEGLFGEVFQNQNFSRVSFATQDLDGMNFAGAAFRGSSFDLARLGSAGFAGALVDRSALTKSVDWPEAVGLACGKGSAQSGTNKRPPARRSPVFESWAPFSDAHHLPELVKLPHDLEVDDVAPELRKALRAGRVALGRYPVRDVEFMAITDPGRIETTWRKALSKYPLDRDRAPLGSSSVTFKAAQDYVRFLNDQVRADYRLPPRGLLMGAFGRARRDGVDLFGGPREPEFVLDDHGKTQILAADGELVGYNPSYGFTDARVRVMQVFKE